ncbi:Uma2 family endonuclease [Dyadobacter sp. CY345]|uniref:Uma2 family endonuclease n=1 Tax=Dyadobacter sp. CY345 TaxID=2909335 RepID=UPI001F191B84|nr:Uma2 family endonuclease [Dyadobacter sp. CY345]MCF2445175.1 Uma2 family endonuclease [Dyadobacter sp. CY345]
MDIQTSGNETSLEKSFSLNSSRVRFCISLLLSKYDAKFDVMPELELELFSGRAKPDISIFQNLVFNWEEDIIRYTEPPITAIEILSPTQAYDALTGKIRKIYFPSCVQSAWIVMPSVKTLQLFLPDNSVQYFTDSLFLDPVTNIELDLKMVFK